MKTLLLSAVIAAGVLSAAASLWLVAALALSRRRGREVARWLREHEGPEWPDRPMPRRKVQVQFHNPQRHECRIGRRA